MNSSDLLVEWCRQGWRYRKISQRPGKEQDWYAERVKYELDLMLSKDLADFFLATSDMVRWAKDYRGPEAPQGIPMGPGRGSVAASVVAWLIRITEVDPIRYPALLFERFLDVTRTDPPDIDLDISDEHRYLVRDYMAQRYGADCVGTVANFVRYRGKNSLADVARVYNVPHFAKETVSNLIIERSGGDSRFDATLEDTIGMFQAAQEIFAAFPDLWKATKLEGNTRGMSVHAAGLIVSNTPLTDMCAVYEREVRKEIRQVLSIDKYDVEYAGLLKMDILGLSTMGVIARCLEMSGLALEDLYAIEDTDEQALEIFRSGDVTGIFQFEGRATRLVNRDVHPDNFFEVADINALSRPGPLFSGTTAEYCDVKHGRREPERYHPIVDRITAHTKGQIVYQEQILQIVREVGGFDWTNANEIRRIISKKIGEAAFNVSMGRFVEGAERIHGIRQETAERIWKRIVTSGTYAFVYAHSVSYSTLGLWCAWLKAHQPLEFYASHLAKTDNTEAGSEQRFKLMKDAQAHGIDIRPPKIGVSRGNWIAHHDLANNKRELIAGWLQIPGIGGIMADRIEEEQDCAPFLWWDDMQRVPGIGAKTVQKIADFASLNDPFGLHITEKRLAKVREWIGKQGRLPVPTHDGNQIAAIRISEQRGRKKWQLGPKVIYIGIVRERAYQDAAENIRSRTGEEMEDILKAMKRPDLLKYCSLRCYDTTEEEVYLRINRWNFPRLKRIIESITVGHDVIVCEGNRIAGFGTPVVAEHIYVIDPDD